jgi:hypothetical protein
LPVHDEVVDTVGGLPAHPLIVHAVVMLLPLAVLGSVAIAARPNWNRPYAFLTATAGVLGAAAATLAKLAGDWLSEVLRLSPSVEAQVGDHGRYGLYVVVAAWPFAALTVATAILGRRQNVSSMLTRTVAVLTTVGGRGVLGLTFLAGHSGSTAVWAGRL